MTSYCPFARTWEARPACMVKPDKRRPRKPHDAIPWRALILKYRQRWNSLPGSAISRISNHPGSAVSWLAGPPRFSIDFGPQFALSGNNMRVRNIIAKGFVCCAAVLGITGTQAREVSGVTMPEDVNVPGAKLRLNGMGVRHEMAFFKGYVIALYLEKPTADANLAIHGDEAKRVVITMLRNVSREMFVQAIESGIMRNSGAEMPALRARLDLLEHAVPDLKKGDVVDLTWVPGAGTLVRGQGRNMTIPGKDFADALFAVWLGPKPVEVPLKHELLGG